MSRKNNSWSSISGVFFNCKCQIQQVRFLLFQPERLVYNSTCSSTLAYKTCKILQYWIYPHGNQNQSATIKSEQIIRFCVAFPVDPMLRRWSNSYSFGCLYFFHVQMQATQHTQRIFWIRLSRHALMHFKSFPGPFVSNSLQTTSNGRHIQNFSTVCVMQSKNLNDIETLLSKAARTNSHILLECRLVHLCVQALSFINNMSLIS